MREREIGRGDEAEDPLGGLKLSEQVLEGLKTSEVDVLTPQIWKQLGALARPSIPPSRPEVGRNGNGIRDRFVGSFVGDDLQMCEAIFRPDRVEQVRDWVMGGEKECTLGWKSGGEEFVMTPDNFVQVGLASLLLSDVGKAGPEPVGTRVAEVVTPLYVDLVLTTKHVRHLQEMGELQRQQLLDELGMDPKRQIAGLSLGGIVEKGILPYLPVVLGMRVALDVGVANHPELREELGTKFVLDDDKNQVLIEAGINPKENTMRELWDKHVNPWGGHFLDNHAGVGPGQRIVGEIALLHHPSQGLVPARFADLKLTAPVVKLAGIGEIADKTQALGSRPVRDEAGRELAGIRNQSIVGMQQMQPVLGEVDGEEIYKQGWRLMEDLGIIAELGPRKD